MTAESIFCCTTASMWLVNVVVIDVILLLFTRCRFGWILLSSGEHKSTTATTGFSIAWTKTTSSSSLSFIGTTLLASSLVLLALVDGLETGISTIEANYRQIFRHYNKLKIFTLTISNFYWTFFNFNGYGWYWRCGCLCSSSSSYGTIFCAKHFFSSFK